MNLTKAQLIKSLENVPDDEPIAFGGFYIKADLEDEVLEEITPEIWASFAAEFNSNERLSNDIHETFSDLVLDKNLTWRY